MVKNARETVMGTSSLFPGREAALVYAELVEPISLCHDVRGEDTLELTLSRPLPPFLRLLGLSPRLIELDDPFSGFTKRSAADCWVW